MKILGIALIVLGVLGLAYGGLTWTTREKVIDVGPVEVSHDKTRSLPLPPIAGALCVVAGIVVMATSSRRT